MTMKNNNLKFAILILSLFVSIQMFFTTSAFAQRRDYLNELEIELVRDAQMIDLRTEVFVKAIDRRFLVINNQPVTDDKKSKKDSEKWGELPVGTRSELLLDIEKILAAAIDNIDDVAVRDKKSELLPKAVRILADGANRFLPQLKSQLDKTNDQKEKGAIIGAIDFCNQIIEASAKIPADAKKKKS
ncbi:hypothetical protein BH24ACI1_BH24ACI1_01410 [soil metagenome]|jgi:hypothetical protein